MRWIWMVTLFALTQVQGIMVVRAEVKIPPPEERLSYDEARRLHNLFLRFLSNRSWQDIPLPEEYIRLLERLLLDFPDERYLLERGLGLGERIERRYVRTWLAYAYRLRGEWDEYLALSVQDFMIDWLENLEKKAGLRYGIPMFTSPDPFRGDPPAAIVWLAKNIQEMQGKGARFSPLIFLHGWCLRVRWGAKILKMPSSPSMTLPMPSSANDSEKEFITTGRLGASPSLSKTKPSPSQQEAQKGSSLAKKSSCAIL